VSAAEKIARAFALEEHVAELERLLVEAKDVHEYVLTETEFEPHVRKNTEQLNSDLERAAKALGQMLTRWAKVDAGTRSVVSSLAIGDKGKSDTDALTRVLRDVRDEAITFREHHGALSYGPGAPRELHGLHAVARLIAPFWERTKGSPFKYNNRPAEKKRGVKGFGGAQGFLYAVAKELDAEYTLANCNSVMRGRRRKRRAV
jgi:hypothetical protein